MSTDNCKSCLTEVTTSILKEYSGSKGVWCYVGSCIVRYEIYSFFGSPSTAEAPANKSVATSLSKSKHSNKIPTILGVVVGGGLLLALLVCLFTTRRRLKSAIYRREYEVHEQVEEDTLVGEDRQIVAFKMETLVAATENFHDDNKLGEGGFGPVYKGATHDGKEIAVKKLSMTSMQGQKEFRTEVKLVAKIQHRNLVKLLGCCDEGSEKLLVYEYLPNSSLDKILFDPIKRKELDWKKRYNIILGVARGLLYLHEDSQPRIIHRDIKASNILLDENWNPKIADFGLAKLFPDNESYVGTLTKVAGTPGYMAPEYAMHSQLTAKADVYSFGVLLLELVTGRKNMDYNLSPEMQNLLRWVWRSYEGGNNVEIVDPVATIESCDEEQALRCIHIGLLCTQVDSSLRPPMSIVTLMLSSHSVPLPDLTNPVFANSDSRINMSYSSSFSGLSRASATTSSSSSDLVPAPPSNAYSSSIELVPRSY
jgi:serine/threonine protein kinase